MLLRPETIKLVGNTKNKITEDENGKNVPHLEITDVVLVHCNFVSNDYQQDSKVSHKFVPNRCFGQLLVISPKNFTFSKVFKIFYICMVY